MTKLRLAQVHTAVKSKFQILPGVKFHIRLALTKTASSLVYSQSLTILLFLLISKYAQVLFSLKLPFFSLDFPSNHHSSFFHSFMIELHRKIRLHTLSASTLSSTIKSSVLYDLPYSLITVIKSSTIMSLKTSCFLSISYCSTTLRCLILLSCDLFLWFMINILFDFLLIS